MWYFRGREQADDRWAISQLEAELRQAHQEGDHARSLSLVSAEPIEAWFALDPEKLAEILAANSPRQLRSSDPAVALDAYVRGDRPALHTLLNTLDNADPLDGDQVRKTQSTDQLGDQGSYFVRVLDALLLRRLGRTSSAAQNLETVLRTLNPTIAPHESTLKFAPIIANEFGTSLFLAGRLDESLRVYMSVHDGSLPQFPFIVRDARVGAALIHAAFGDPQVAHGHLEVAQDLPRTRSWYEAIIDVHVKLAEALLAPPSEGIALFDRLPTHLIGEFWPFLVIGEQILLTRAGRRHEATVRLQQRVSAHPVPTGAEGLIGSAFHLASARLHIEAGNTRDAQQQLERADPSLLLTRLFMSEAALEAGESKSALLMASRLASETSALRHLDLLRVRVVAGAHLRRGKPTFAAEELKRASERWGSLNAQDLSLFPAPLRRLQVLQGETETEMQPPLTREVPRTPLSLTRRETEVLNEIASGRNRKEIAARLFISENTVKTHQRSVFRKLDASSRTDAIGRAALLGLLSDTHRRGPTNLGNTL